MERGNEVSFYSRRRLIIGEIRRLAWPGGEGGLSRAATAKELETRQQQAGLSLTRLNELLRRPQRRENVSHGRARKGQRRRR